MNKNYFTQKGSATMLLLFGFTIVAGITLFTPLPYYSKEYCDLPCPSPVGNCSYCQKPGWYLGTNLWKQLISKYSQKTEKDTVRVNPPLSTPEVSSSPSAGQTNEIPISEAQAIEIAKKATQGLTFNKMRAIMVDHAKYGKLWEVDLFVENRSRAQGQTILINIENGNVIEILNFGIIP